MTSSTERTDSSPDDPEPVRVDTARQAEFEVGEHDEERPARRLSGRVELFVWAASVAIALLVLKQVFLPFAKGSQYYLVIFLGVTLPLVFLCYRPRGHRAAADGESDNPGPLDWVFAAIALVVGLYPVLPLAIGDFGGGYDAFLDRQGVLSTSDIVAGTLLLVLILEATRRTTGLVLPAVCLVFLAYSYYGGYLPPGWDIAHAGVDFSQIINALYNDQSGFYGIPLDVAATYIVLFTIYGAVLAQSGAGKFFVDLSFALFRRSRTAPGRTAAMSGFLLGTVSGSGTATTVSLGAITWPVLRRAGYPRENAGGLLAASGIGAILSPPTLGAAAFIIAEYLETPYLTVLVWAIVPTLLYYLGIAFAVEADARRFGAKAVDIETKPVGRLLLQGGYHFISLAIIVVFLALDIPAFTAVVYASGVAALFALAVRLVAARRAGSGTGAALAGWVRSLADALAEGIRGALPVIAVCAAAGVITSTITKTGLGQELAACARGRGPGARLEPDRGAGAHRRLRGGGGQRARPRGAGDGVVHHRVGRARPGARGPGRGAARGRDVHLLLRGAVRGDAADGARVGRGGRDHRRLGDADDVADVEVHAAGLPRADRVRADRQRLGVAAAADRSSPRCGWPPCPRSASPRSPSSRAAGCSARPGGRSVPSVRRPPCCCSTSSRSRSGSAWPASPWRSSCTY